MEWGRAAWRRWLGRRRVRVWLAVAFVLIVVRIALPVVLRKVAVSRVNEAIVGHVDIGDVDLWLLRGGLALKDVSVRVENAAASDPPLLAFKQFYVRIGYLPLFRRTVRIEDVALDGLAVHVDRLESGAIALPGVRPTPPAPEPKPAAAPSKPWNIAVDRAAVGEGHFRLHDEVAKPPADAELVLDALALTGFTLQYGGGAEPGHGTVEAKFGDGSMRVDTTVATEADGFAVDAHVTLTNLPVDRTQLHVPQLGWKSFVGRVDAAVDLHAHPGETPHAAGTLAIRDLRVDVPDEATAALGWRRLDVDLERIDPIARQALVKRVALDGAEVVVTPRAATPLPLLPVRQEAAPPPAEEAPAEPAKPWTWRVDTLEVTDTKASVLLEPPPLELQIVRAAVTGLASERGSRAEVALELREETGTVHVDGSVGLDPLVARVTTRIDALPLARLVAATGAAPVQFPGGTLGGEVTVQTEPAPLTVTGQLALADLKLASPAGEDFGLGWKRLEVGLRQVQVPGVLPGDAKGPMRVDLERVRLVGLAATLTRAPEGFVLPTPKAPADAAPRAETPPQVVPPPVEPPPAAPPPAAASTQPPLTLALGRLDVENGQVDLVDRTVQPFYRGRVAAITVHAHGLHYPENVFDDVTFSARLPGNAPLSLDGKQTKGRGQLQASMTRVPLAQFNPYVTQSAGYSIGRGAVTFGAKLRWSGDSYQSQNTIELDQLTVGGAQGDSLFAQRFGVPLSLALALMRDVHGKIALDVPIQGDKASGTRVDVGAVVTEALAHAIVNAIASPLKLMGALSLDGSKVAAFEPEPIVFVAGRTGVDPASRERLGQLASVLAGAPALGVQLTGAAGPADVRALQEDAVLADLQADQGVIKGIRNLANRGERNAIRDALRARTTGGSAPALTPDQQATLDKWAAEKTIADDQLRALASARGEALKTALGKEFGIDPKRVALGEAAVDRDGGRPIVTVGLGS